MSEFFAMGGYANFVWTAYGLTVIVLVFNIVSARRRLRTTLEDLAMRDAHRANRSKT
jgi:heme exporter protein D